MVIRRAVVTAALSSVLLVSAHAQDQWGVESLADQARSNANAIGRQGMPSRIDSAPELAELAERVEYTRANANELIGQELVESIPQRFSDAREQYASEMDDVRVRTAEIFEQGLELAKELAGSQYSAVKAQGGLGQPDESAWRSPEFRLFISQSMPLEEVKALAELAKEDPGVVLVMRGLRPDQNITEVHRWIYRLLSPIEEGGRIPNITLDPEPFNELGVDHVPVLAQYDRGGKLLAFASGMTNRTWLAEQVKSGRRGHLGAYGPMVPVAEVDIIEVLKARAANFDWKGSAAGALDRFWARTEAHEIPIATTDRVRMLDPTFEISESIYAPDGQVVAAAGDRFNPLDAVPFNSILVFFNPAVPAQVQWARQVVRDHRGRKVTLMASQLRTLDGLDDLGKLGLSLGAPVFSLPDNVRSTFSIERVPTIVTAQGREFRIHELAL